MEEEGEIMGYRPRDEMIEPAGEIIAVHPTILERYSKPRGRRFKIIMTFCRERQTHEREIEIIDCNDSSWLSGNIGCHNILKFNFDKVFHKDGD